MRKLFTLLFALTFVSLSVSAQTKEAKTKIIQQTNVEYLQKFSKEAKIRFEANKKKAMEMAFEKGWVIREDKDGKLIELVGVTKNGTPLYYETYNVDAANSTRANTLHNGGSLGLNIEGQNMTAHVWDGGLARSTHQEYDGPGGTNRFSIGDGTSALHYHAAHVAGTIMSSGVDPDAKGMAPQAYVVGYEWNNDVSEATAAAANGMLVSNHSYGYNAELIDDDMFGQYGSDAVDWDGLMYNAPYYLMLVAAGNDGADDVSNAAPLDGNSAYDKLSGHTTAKNNLVVANAQDANIDEFGNLTSVLINTGSSEGPTDDYRIKPDITGNGTQLYSTYESTDDAYNSISGTSMATPNVTGSLLLLQQYYNDLYSEFMKAATLKGLALHTADDAGASGPDVIYGWGLLNTKKAAELIAEKDETALINQQILANGSSFTIDVIASGTEDLIASISWTDPAGTVNSGTNSTTAALVNDLDIRITESTNTFYPYKLASITANTTADNTVDPYERIDVDSPGAGTAYTITVTHKGTLSTPQNYSLIVSGIVVASDMPTVTTAEVSNLTQTTATGGGNVIDEGIASVTERGIVWGLNPNPTISDNKIVDVGTGAGSYISLITGLSAATTYYVRAFAKSTEGTSYGDNKKFTTECGIFTPPYSEDFEGGTLTTCWENDFGSAFYGWKVGMNGISDYLAIPAHTNYAYINDDACNCDMSDVWLITPELDFSFAASASLSFASFATSTYGGICTIKYSIDGGTSWTDLSTITANAVWETITEDLVPVVGSNNVKLAFHYNDENDWATGWAIDDVEISMVTAGTLYTVTFAATDAGDNHPIDGATVSINSTTLTTDAGGEATIDLLDGSYPYTVTKSGYDNGTGTVTVSGATTTESVSLSESAYTLTFVVVDENSQAIENASISINSTTLSTDVNGEATIDLINGDYSYTVSKTGYDDATGTATIAGAPVTQDVTLTIPTYTVSFTVTDAGDSHALDGASIVINSTTLTTDLNGQSSIDLADGTYAYTVTRTGYNEANGSVTVSGAAKAVSVSMIETTYTLTFAVVDESSQAVESATIDINSTTLATDINGEATIDLPDGDYNYTVTKTGFTNATDIATISGANATENVTLAVPTYTVTFNVTDAGDSHALDGAVISINSATLTTNTSGEATIDLENGDYPYTVTKAGYENASSTASVLGASFTEDVSMTAYPEITFSTDLVNVTCNGGNDGQITFANVAGGSTTGFEYSIDGGTTWKTSASFSNLYANTYSAQVKDDAGNFSTLSSVEITQPDVVTFDASVTNVSVYGGSDGSIEFIDIAGGTSPYEFSINGGANWSSTNPISGLEPGSYDLQVRDVNGCLSSETSVTITQPAEPQYTVTFNVTDAGDAHVIEGASISINSTALITNVDGIATIDLVDGDYPYMVSFTGYDNASGTIAVSGGVVTENVVIYKSNNVLTFVVEDESATAVEGASISVNSTTLTTDASGTAFITLPNGGYAYTVTKDGYAGGNGNVIMAGDDVTENVTLYAVANTVTFNVTDGADPLLGVNIDINGTTLLTDGSGIATINLPDGTYPYTATSTGYDVVTESITVSGADITENVTMVESAYPVTFNVQDENALDIEGATITINSTILTTDASGQATIELLNGSYSYTVTKAGLANANGSVTVAGAGESQNVTMYSTAHLITFNVTSSSGGGAIEGASVSINSTTLLTDASGAATINLPDGDYNYSVVKEGFESAAGSVTLSGVDVSEDVAMNAIIAITFNTTITNIYCYGAEDGEVEFTDVTGGSGSGYEYSVNGGASWQANAIVTGLTAGTFNALVRDDAGNLSNTESITIIQPSQITGFIVNTENVTTFGGTDGSIAINGVTGGSGVYEYSINDGATWQASSLFENLAAGNYNVVVKDSYGCEVVVGSVTITEPAEQEYTVTFEVFADNHVFEGARIEINSTVITTNTDGEAFIDLVDGSYDYVASINGFDNISGAVLVEGAAVTETISFVGIEGAFASQISIYPNPTSSTLTIELDGKYKVTLVNGIGNVIVQKEMNAKGALEVDQYADGLYLLRIEQNGQVITKPVIINK